MNDKNTRVEINVASLMRSDVVVKAWERETHLEPEHAKPGDFFLTMAKALAQHNCTERSTTYRPPGITFYPRLNMMNKFNNRRLLDNHKTTKQAANPKFLIPSGLW